MNGSETLVCVVDDDQLVREGLNRLLRSAGLKAQTFASAQDFLNEWPSEAVSCLVLDVQLPGVSGLDLQQNSVAAAPRSRLFS